MTTEHRSTGCHFWTWSCSLNLVRFCFSKASLDKFDIMTFSWIYNVSKFLFSIYPEAEAPSGLSCSINRSKQALKDTYWSFKKNVERNVDLTKSQTGHGIHSQCTCIVAFVKHSKMQNNRCYIENRHWMRISVEHSHHLLQSQMTFNSMSSVLTLTIHFDTVCISNHVWCLPLN